MNRPNRFIGVDVQTADQCPYAVLDENGQPVDSGWLAQDKGFEAVRALCEVVGRHSGADPSGVAVGIDAPREPLLAPRRWYWDGSKAAWRECRASDRGNGRHCEIVVAAHRIANPQWTPHAPPFPAWMQLGFTLFDGLNDVAAVYEVFPSASYSLLRGDPSIHFGVRLGDFAPGPKDMLDAYVAAATIREFVQGRGEAVGGGDGHGEIILPRPLPAPIDAVLRWPAV